jgi:REP element-mobilizing transposase RayT
MGRKPRIHYVGAVYHAMARGVDGRDIFIEDRDRRIFLKGLSRTVEESSAEVLAYCLMGNHFHLAVRVGHVSLASIMQRLLTGYSLAFNRRYDRTGHLFQARYKAILCLDDAYLLGLVRYIHMNPVRAGLTSTPQEWPWSSLGGQGQDNFEAGSMEFDPWPNDMVRSVDLMRCPKTDEQDIADIGEAISARTGIHLQELRSETRRRAVVAAKRLFTQEAVRRGHSLIFVAKWLNSTRSSATRYARGNTAHTGRPDTIFNSR